METVSVRRDVLLEDLGVRAEAHRASWEMACRLMDERIVAEMRRRIRAWKRGGALDTSSLEKRMAPFPRLQPPGAPYYRRAVAFVELAEDALSLDERQVMNWVDDDWVWTAEWQRTCKELGVV